MVSASAFDEIRILRFTICHMIYVLANKSIQTNNATGHIFSKTGVQKWIL